MAIASSCRRRSSTLHACLATCFALTSAVSLDSAARAEGDRHAISAEATISALHQPSAQASPTTRPASAQQAPSSGPILADPPGVDFGLIEPGTTVSATIKLVNPLDQPVKIKLAKPSCTCTTVDMTGKVIPAKGFIEMPMSMKTASSVGKRSAKINLVFEGLDQLLSVELVAETAYQVRANPPFIDALAPERMKGFFELIARDNQPFMVLTVDGAPAKHADGSPMTPAVRHVVSYDFTQLGSRPVPPYLIVETDHPKSPLVDLRVRHETTRISPALSFAEFRENVGILKPQGSTEVEVQIKNMGTQRLTGVESLDPAFKVELLSQTSDGEALLAKVRFTDVALPKGTFLRSCRFKTAQKQADFLLYGCVR